MPLITERNKPIVIIVALLIIIGSLVSIFLSQWERRPKIDVGPSQALGQVAAEETGKLLGGQGRIVVISMDTSKWSAPTMQAQMQAFEEALKTTSITIAGTELIQFVVEEMPPPDMGLSVDKYRDVLDKYANVDAIVSFVGAPLLRPDDLRQLPAQIPKMLAVVNFPMGLKQLIIEDVVQVAIVPRMTPPEDMSQEPKTPQEKFERYYQIVTAENVDSLPMPF